MSRYNELMEVNRVKWQEMTDLNLKGDLYNFEKSLSADDRGLDSFIWDELGSVDGLDVLHLQCHFGLDSIALARAGARVTGLDFSSRAIETAREFAEKTGTDVRFVEGNLYDAPDLIDGKFDLIYVSWGTICWLPDIEGWAGVIGHFLKPGGQLYFCDQHPYVLSFDDEMEEKKLLVRYPYFHGPEGLVFDDDRAYGNSTAKMENTITHEWTHGIGSVVTALAKNDVVLEWLHEHPFISWPAFPWLEKHDDDGMWHLPEEVPSCPLSYSFKARKQ